jgi:hypothetical protein
MLAGRVEKPAQIHKFRPVELQGVDCDASSGRQANDTLETFIPGEMFLPMLSARMKQMHRLTRYGISCPCFVVFVVVASLAG